MFEYADPQTRRDFLRAIAVGAGSALAARLHADGISTAPLEIKSPPAPGSHRIASCNILLDLAEHKGTPLDWKSGRRKVCLDVIRAYNASILCLQEVGARQQVDFEKAFPEYDTYGFYGPVSDRKPPRFQAIRNVILYARDRYRLMSAGGYTLSETPLIDGSRLPDNSLGRHVNWVRLQDKSTGRHFRVLDTHLSLTPLAREKETAIIAAETSQYQPDFPQVLCGDLNSGLKSKEQSLLQAADWKDTYSAVHAEPFVGKKIDFIYTRGGLKAVSTELIREIRDEIPASDHPFLVADLQFI